MANTTIPNLPEAVALNGGEYMWAVQSGTDVRVTVAQVAGIAQGALVRVANGGTGVDTIANNSLVIGQDANPIATIPNGTNGQFLTAQTNGPPQWSTFTPGQSVTSIDFSATGLTPTGPTSGPITVGGVLSVSYGGTGSTNFTSGGVLYGAGFGAVQASPAPAQGAILIGESASVTWLSAGTVGQILQTNGPNADPTWVNLPGTGVATISFGSTGLTPSSPTGGSVTVAGTLNTTNGGTGLSTFTAANNAIYSTSASNLTAGTLPTAAGGTGLTVFNSGKAVYATSSSALSTGTLPIGAGGTGLATVNAGGALYSLDGATLISGALPVVAGGTGSNASTGSGAVVLAVAPTLQGPNVTSLNGGQLAGFRNRIINGNMSISQRFGTVAQTLTAGAGAVYTVDRFFASCAGANMTWQQVSNSGPASAPSQFAVQFNGFAGVTSFVFGTRIRSADCYDLAGTTTSFAINIANSLLSSATWTASYATVADNFTTTTQFATGVFAISGVNSRQSVQITVPAAATTGVQITISLGAQISGTCLIGGWQWEPGPQPTPQERRLHETELLLCQTYYQVLTGTLFAPVANLTQFGGAVTSLTYLAPMRAIPTAAASSTTSGGGWVTPTGITGTFGTNSCQVNASATQTTAGAFNTFSLTLSAEL